MLEDLCHQNFLKSAKCSLPPKTNDRLQIYFGIQIYSSKMCQFCWSQSWVNLFAFELDIAQCVKSSIHLKLVDMKGIPLTMIPVFLGTFLIVEQKHDSPP